jgi:hypothetical protein
LQYSPANGVHIRWRGASVIDIVLRANSGRAGTIGRVCEVSGTATALRKGYFRKQTQPSFGACADFRRQGSYGAVPFSREDAESFACGYTGQNLRRETRRIDLHDSVHVLVQV